MDRYYRLSVTKSGLSLRGPTDIFRKPDINILCVWLRY